MSASTMATSLQDIAWIPGTVTTYSCDQYGLPVNCPHSLNSTSDISGLPQGFPPPMYLQQPYEDIDLSQSLNNNLMQLNTNNRLLNKDRTYAQLIFNDESFNKYTDKPQNTEHWRRNIRNNLLRNNVRCSRVYYSPYLYSCF
jgi:hypothetical protein